jgi:hypothetical protein
MEAEVAAIIRDVGKPNRGGIDRQIINRTAKLDQKAEGISAARTRRHFGAAMKDVRTYPPVIVIWSEFDKVQSTYDFGTQVCSYIVVGKANNFPLNLTRASGTFYFILLMVF